MVSGLVFIDWGVPIIVEMARGEFGCDQNT